jgi:hypothetical protein
VEDKEDKMKLLQPVASTSTLEPLLKVNLALKDLPQATRAFLISQELMLVPLSS